MGAKSRNKGAQGEREVRDLLRAAGFGAQRGAQHSGTVKCVGCNGRGWKAVARRVADSTGYDLEPTRCPRCNGKGTIEAPDVITEAPIHPEAKLLGAGLNVYAALAQAERDAAADKVPVVFYRRTGKGSTKKKPWVVVLKAEDYLRQIGGQR